MAQDTPPRSLGKDLLWYAAAAGVVIAAPAADAQIVYTDVDPDEVVSGATFAIDFDGDGTDDVGIFHSVPNSVQNLTGIYNYGNAVAGYGPAGSFNYFYASPVAAGSPISSGIAFASPTAGNATVPQGNLRAFSTYVGNTYGNFPDGAEAYMGVQFTAGGGTTHYAWIRVETSALAGDITVKDYAFEATPDMAIDAGAMPTAIEPGPDGLPGTHNLSSAFPNPFNAGARFTLEVAEQQDVLVEVFNAVGQRVATLHDGALTAGSVHEFDIDGSDLASGVYLIRTVGERFSDMQQVTLVR